MAQVTIYIPNDLESQIKAMTSSLNISISKFISTLLEQKVQNEWSYSSRKQQIHGMIFQCFKRYEPIKGKV